MNAAPSKINDPRRHSKTALNGKSPRVWAIILISWMLIGHGINLL